MSEFTREIVEIKERTKKEAKNFIFLISQCFLSTELSEISNQVTKLKQKISRNSYKLLEVVQIKVS